MSPTFSPDKDEPSRPPTEIKSLRPADITTVERAQVQVGALEVHLFVENGT